MIVARVCTFFLIFAVNVALQFFYMKIMMNSNIQDDLFDLGIFITIFNIVAPTIFFYLILLRKGLI